MSIRLIDRRVVLCARLLFGVLVLSVALLVVLCFIQVDEKYPCHGIIRPADEMSVFAQDDAIIKDVRVVENMRIKKGDVLFQLDDFDLVKQREALDSQQHELEAQLTEQQKHVEKVAKTALPNWLQFSDIDTQKNQQTLDYQKYVLEKYGQLVQSGAISQMDYQKAKLDVQNAESEETRSHQKHDVVSNDFIDSSVEEAKADIGVTQTKLQNLKADRALLDQEFARRVLRADLPGVITMVLKRYPGEKVARGEELARYSASEHLQLDLYGGERNVYLVHAGQRVQFSTASFSPWTEGYCFGTVKFIDPDSTQATNISSAMQSANYFLEVNVDQTPAPLKLGSSVTADVLLRQTSLFKAMFNLD